MSYPHGSENRRKRIEMRADEIYHDFYGVGLGTEPDPTDINHGEAEEITEARILAEKWLKQCWYCDSAA